MLYLLFVSQDSQPSTKSGSVENPKKGGCSPLSNADEPQKVILFCLQTWVRIQKCDEKCL